jgi:hypothetical protein
MPAIGGWNPGPYRSHACQRSIHLDRACWPRPKETASDLPAPATTSLLPQTHPEDAAHHRRTIAAHRASGSAGDGPATRPASPPPSPGASTGRNAATLNTLGTALPTATLTALRTALPTATLTALGTALPTATLTALRTSSGHLHSGSQVAALLSTPLLNAALPRLCATRLTTPLPGTHAATPPRLWRFLWLACFDLRLRAQPLQLRTQLLDAFTQQLRRRTLAGTLLLRHHRGRNPSQTDDDNEKAERADSRPDSSCSAHAGDNAGARAIPTTRHRSQAPNGNAAAADRITATTRPTPVQNADQRPPAGSVKLGGSSPSHHARNAPSSRKRHPRSLCSSNSSDNRPVPQSANRSRAQSLTTSN